MFWRLGASRRALSTDSGLIRVSERVREALSVGQAVVALESTIITHGMPQPHNLHTAREVEEVVWQHGAVPATVALLGGVLHVGLTDLQLAALAQSRTAVKLSRRDLPHAISQQGDGGTTVSATMLAAHAAGISVFVTGGIGGVHRGGEDSWDVSADLTELGRTPLAVVSAGVKSILDIGRTLEYLETQGVAVATVGELADFPAFFVPTSGFQAPCTVRTPQEAASMIHSRDKLNLDSGILFAVPIPKHLAAQGEMIEAAILQALREAKARGVTGKMVTPFVLGRVNDITEGASLKANIGLVKNNARVGSEIAVELSRLKSRTHHRALAGTQTRPRHPVVVVGASNLDVIAKVSSPDVKRDGSTNKGRVELAAGGVGRNLAACLATLGACPLLVSAVGRDTLAATLLALNPPDLDPRGLVHLEGSSTATYVSLLSAGGENMLGVGDMAIHARLTPALLAPHMDAVLQARLVALDANLSADTLDFLLQECHAHSVPVWLEPTDTGKASKALAGLPQSWPSYASPNLAELHTMADLLHPCLPAQEDEPLLSACLRLSEPLLTGPLHTLVVTAGPRGVVVLSRLPPDHLLAPLKAPSLNSPVHARHFPAPQSPVVSVSGAGDCLAGAMMAAMLRGGFTMEQGVDLGQTCAALSLQSTLTVPPTLRHHPTLTALWTPPAQPHQVSQ